MSADVMLVQKRVFEMPFYETVGGKPLKNVRVGYETYGTLSPGRDNVVLIPHYFTANSHAAGKYSEQDALPGYWDMLIGPGKAIDTNRYFVISVDCLSNMNADANTITTGPASIDPDTGEPYGLRFPAVLIRDFVNVQHALLQSLDINRIHAVMGVSMGSMQAMAWAANYPGQVERVIALTPNGVAVSDYGVQMLGLWARAVRLDPKWNGGDYYGKAQPIDGLAQALAGILHSARHWHWAAQTYGRRVAVEQKDPADGLDNLFAIEDAFSAYSYARAAAMDANSFLYLVKANQVYSLQPGSADGDYRKIKAPTLLITVDTDLLLAPENAIRFGKMLKENGVQVQMEQFSTAGGHLAGVLEAGATAEWIADFVSR
jgi:homoserine O-acetyltransferase